MRATQILATLVVSYKFQNLYLFQIYNSILNSIAYSLLFLQCLTSTGIVQHTSIFPSQQGTTHGIIVSLAIHYPNPHPHKVHSIRLFPG